MKSFSISLKTFHFEMFLNDKPYINVHMLPLPNKLPRGKNVRSRDKSTRVLLTKPR
jgi:hypothetical protein